MLSKSSKSNIALDSATTQYGLAQPEARTHSIWRSRPCGSQTRLLLTHSSLAIIAQIVRMAVGLFIVPFTLAYLGQERYGLWMLTASTLAFIGLLDAGLAPTLKNRMAEAFARHDEDAFQYYASGGWALACTATIVGLALLPVLNLMDWASIYGVTGAIARNEARDLTLACFALAVLSVALSFVDALFAARMMLGTVYLFTTAASLVSAAAVIAAVHLRAGLVPLAITATSPQIIARIALLVFAERKGLIKFSARLSDITRLLRDVMPNSMSFLGIKFVEAMLAAIPNLIATRVSGLSAVTILSVGLRLITIPLLLVAAVVPVFWPSFTIAWSRNDLERLRSRYLRLILVTVCVLALYACASVLIGPSVLHLWLHGAVSVPRSVLAMLGLWMVLQGVGHWLSTFLHSTTDLHSQLVSYSVQAALAAGLGIFLCNRHGLLGLSTSMAVALALATIAPLSYRVYTKLTRNASS